MFRASVCFFAALCLFVALLVDEGGVGLSCCVFLRFSLPAFRFFPLFFLAFPLFFACIFYTYMYNGVVVLGWLPRFFFPVFWGCVVAGFVSVSSSRGAGVVARSLSGGWVWARRALPSGAGWSPAPACVFVPFPCLSSACAVGRVLASRGFRVWVRAGSAGSPVFAACGLPVPAFVVKVAVPAGWRSAALVAFVRSVLSAGVVVSAPVALAA